MPRPRIWPLSLEASLARYFAGKKLVFAFISREHFRRIKIIFSRSHEPSHYFEITVDVKGEPNSYLNIEDRFDALYDAAVAKIDEWVANKAKAAEAIKVCES